MNRILADFAKVEVKTKRIVVHDGIGQSYLINMDLQSEMIKAANIDYDLTRADLNAVQQPRCCGTARGVRRLQTKWGHRESPVL